MYFSKKVLIEILRQLKFSHYIFSGKVLSKSIAYNTYIISIVTESPYTGEKALEAIMEKTSFYIEKLKEIKHPNTFHFETLFLISPKVPVEDRCWSSL